MCVRLRREKNVSNEGGCILFICKQTHNIHNVKHLLRLYVYACVRSWRKHKKSTPRHMNIQKSARHISSFASSYFLRALNICYDERKKKIMSKFSSPSYWRCQWDEPFQTNHFIFFLCGKINNIIHSFIQSQFGLLRLFFYSSFFRFIHSFIFSFFLSVHTAYSLLLRTILFVSLNSMRKLLLRPTNDIDFPFENRTFPHQWLSLSHSHFLSHSMLPLYVSFCLLYLIYHRNGVCAW